MTGMRPPSVFPGLQKPQSLTPVAKSERLVIKQLGDGEGVGRIISEPQRGRLRNG